MTERRYARRFRVRAAPEEVRAFHEDPRALRRLMPAPMQALGPPERLREGLRVRFRVWLGPFPVRWEARHEQVGEGGFVDVMERGPFLSWRHEHRYRPAPGGGTEVEDAIQARFAPGLRGLAGRAVWAGLRPAFAYRAWVTRRAVERD